MSHKTEKENLLNASTMLHAIIEEVQKVVVGQDILLRNLVIALFAKGHIILEGVPGLAKTLSIETLAKTIGVDYARLQFTPDLLPSDLIGTKVYDPSKGKFNTKKGPIFANLVLADEINRAPAKVQSALLESMAEKQVTIGEERHKLPSPFVVMATQNPIEQEGTYSLPEAQLDRFLLKTVISYPSEEEELEIMKRMTSGHKVAIKKITTAKKILETQEVINEVHVSDNIFEYVRNIIFATRYPDDRGLEEVSHYMEFWASPRASLALIQSAKVIACMHDRDFVIPEDIKEIAPDVLRHRIILSYEAIADDISTDDIIDTLLQTIEIV